MTREEKDKIARNAASIWSRCFKCDGIINTTHSTCNKGTPITCHKWYDGYRTALIALGDERLQPSLPSDGLDEAAEAYRRKSLKYAMFPPIDGPVSEYGGSIKGAFKAGAEWMAGQGEIFESTVLVDAMGDSHVEGYYLSQKIAEGEKVIVQIRKK